MDGFDGMTRAQAYERSEDVGSNATGNDTLGDIVNARLGRRDVLKGALATTALATAGGALAAIAGGEAKAAIGQFAFKEIAHGASVSHVVADGYSADILIRWGDPVMPGAPEFDPMNQTAAAQEKQFGYNCDFVGFGPLPYGSNSSDHGLLCVNHEYTDEEVMFPGMVMEQQEANFARMTKDLVEIEMAAHGGTIIEVKKEGGKWTVVKDSPYNRRISLRSTVMDITGPAAGSDRMKTSWDHTGTQVVGTANNCAGGITPWGTYLLAEENFNGYFWGDRDQHPEADKLKRYGAPGGWYAWGRYFDRFHVNKEPNEVNRFGWIVEVDPLDPNAVPKKRTALGRFKHEGAETIVNKDGKVVIYSGDDERFDYVYKFVSEGTFNPNDRAANMDLLDAGTLYVAKYNADGTGEWLPLLYGQGPLTEANGFSSQADVVIDARIAGDLLGATKMDRPEDVEPNRVTNKVYVMLTNNTRRKADAVDATNPRANNAWGQILEMTPTGGDDHAGTSFTWDMLVLAGDPKNPEVGAKWNPRTSENGWFACPDNCAVDHQGRLWVTTDQGTAWKSASGTADGVWALETDGELRGMGKFFFRVPVGAEMCGPCFTPSDETLFVAVQHPATDGAKDFEGFGRNSTFEDPVTRWPDFQDGMPPRPSVVAITKNGGGVIGS